MGARVIRGGGVIAYPTESCFGIGCDPTDRIALDRILRIKDRPAGMGLILIADRFEALLPYIHADESMLSKPRATWPGPYTWIFPASSFITNLAPAVNHSIAVRVTAHPVAAQLCRLAQSAIVSTSANRHGRAPIREYGQVMRIMGRHLDYIVRGALGEQRNTTEIRDAVTGQLIRAG